MAVMVDLSPVVTSMSLLLGQSRPWGSGLNQVAIRQLPATQPPMAASGRFSPVVGRLPTQSVNWHCGRKLYSWPSDA